MIKPLSQTKTLTAEAALNRHARGQKIQANFKEPEPKTLQPWIASQQGSIVPHSSAQAQRTRRYHEQIHAAHTGGRQSSARITDQLNPDQSISQERRQGRRFPGL